LRRKEVSVYEYLSGEEADEFIQLLGASRIFALRQYMTIGEGDHLVCYQVLVDQSDEERALILAEDFRNKLKAKRKRTLHICDLCKSGRSTIILDRSKFSWWRKLMTRGLTVYKCTKCGRVWYTSLKS